MYISKMSLTSQCKELNIPLIDFQLPFNGKPEIALLEYFKLRGYRYLIQ